MSVLVIEPMLTGHRSIYLMRIVRALIAMGEKVLLAVPATGGEGLLGSIDDSSREMVEIIPLDEGRINHIFALPVALREIGAWWFFRKICLSCEVFPRLVIIPYFDYFLHAFSLFGTPFRAAKVLGICMRPAFHLPAMGVPARLGPLSAFKRVLFKLLLRRRVKLLVIDELLARWASARLGGGRLVYLADPGEMAAERSSDLNAELESLRSSFVVLVYGAIDQRKGLTDLVDAVAESDGVTILLVGKQSSATREQVSGWMRQYPRSDLFHIIDRFVTSAEERTVFDACNVVWLGYRNHSGMSGVLILSALANKPVVTYSVGLLGWYTRSYSLGAIMQDSRPETVRQSLEAVRSGRFLPTYAPAHKEFLQGRSWSDFDWTVGVAIRDAQLDS